MTTTEYCVGDLCSFAKGANVPRDRMKKQGLLYLHYGDLYAGHSLYIDVENPERSLPFIDPTEKLRANQFVNNGDIIYILTSETVEDLGKSLCLSNPKNRTVVAGTETTIMQVVRRDIIEPRYLNYLLQTPIFQRKLRQYITGMKVFRVHPRDIARIKISVPPITDQEKVITLLDSIYFKIRLNQQINDHLEKLLSIEFAKLLKNKAQERLLVDAIDILSGGTPKTSNPDYWRDGSIPLFSPRDVGKSPYVVTTEKSITNAGLDNCNSALYPTNTVLLTARGTVGKVAIAGRPMAMNQSCFALVGRAIPQSVVYQAIKKAVAALKLKANGATFAAINTRDLGSEALILPTLEDMKRYDSFAKPIWAYILANTYECSRLGEARDTLLPKLMSGEIDVSRIDLKQLNGHLSES